MDGQNRPKGKRGREGRGNEEENRDVRLSKSLSYALRHGAAKMGLNMSSDGFVFMDELLAHRQFSSFSVNDVERVVATNDKQRFKLRNNPENDRLQIRANQGHTVQFLCELLGSLLPPAIEAGKVEDLELTAVLLDAPDCPQEAIHGSYMKHWPSIRSNGLSRMHRTHIHLAPGLPGDGQVISGMRPNCDLAVYINVPKALADGIEFYWSENKVLLTPGDADGLLPPRYFLHARKLKPSPCELDLE